MQFWPRTQAERIYPAVKSWDFAQDHKILAFAGYKVGMTHLVYTDSYKFSQTKGQDIAIPITILECPPIKVMSVKFYTKDAYGLHSAGQLNTLKQDKELARKLTVAKKAPKDAKDFERKIADYADIRLIVHTQPSLTQIGQKRPEVFEIGLGGTVQEKFAFALDKLGKEISLKDVFKDGEMIDVHGVTKGKGLQGPVKRFGVSIRQHKAEKTKRGPATLGPWNPHNGNFRVPHQGQMGYHTRTEINKWIVKIGNKGEDVNHKGGNDHYGTVKNDYVFIKGSVAGPAKRLLVLTAASRPNKKEQTEPANIQMIALRGK